MRISIVVSCVALSLCADAAIAHSQESGESDRVGQLEGQVQALQAQVAELKRLVADLAEAAPREPVPARGEALGRPRLPTLEWGGFGDVQYQAESFRPDEAPDQTKNRFVLGDLDLFVTSQLSEDVSFLSEIEFEFQEQGENVVDVERLLLKYEYADWLNASAGRGHTPIGYWNTHYHHGRWLYTTVERPLLFEFEDHGGILPIHYVGVELSGRAVATESLLLDYNAVVANGRGRTTEAIQLGDDINDNKMWNFRVGVEPAQLFPELKLGASVLGDQIPKNPAVPGREQSLDELIAGGYLVYLQDPIEFLLEGQWIQHQDSSTYENWGGYAQLAYRYRKVKPYYRFDILQVDPNDPFYAELPNAQNTKQHTFGLRWDWSTFAALKFEYRHRVSKSFDSDVGVTQLSFAF